MNALQAVAPSSSSHDRPYRMFDVALARKVLLTPWMARLTFAGEQIAEMKTGGPDQRIKLLFPRADGAAPSVPDHADSFAAYRRLPLGERGAIRTYTIRRLRPEAREVDIDFVLHGEEGPASRWATHARPGERLQIMGPNRAFVGDPRGYEWRPPAGASQILLAADETALPALAGILEDLATRPTPPETQAFIEAPAGADVIDLPSWPGLELIWLRRAHGASLPGQAMAAAVRGALLPCPGARPITAAPLFEPVDIDRQLLWDRGDAAEDGFYAWVAGEAAAVLAIRAFLVAEHGLDRRSLNLMGYWRHGQALDDPARRG